jgi:hypothetical protein
MGATLDLLFGAWTQRAAVSDIRVDCYIENKSRGIVRASLSKLLPRLSVRIGVQQILAGQ